jgi:acetyltransferase
MSTQRSAASRYPSHYERDIKTKGGVDIFVRPVKPEDAPLMEAFFQTLSDQTIYNRFFTLLKSLEPKMLAEFTQIDYDRGTALVAFDKSQPEDKILGVARIVADPGGAKGEFAVTVSDP